MPEGVTVTNLQDLLDEVNAYRRLLGVSPISMTPGVTSKDLNSQLASLKEQYSRQVGGVQGFGLRSGLTQMPKRWWQPPTQGGGVQQVTPEVTPTEAPAAEGGMTDEQLRQINMLPLRQFEFQKLQSEAGRLQEQNRQAMELDQMRRGMEWMQRQNQLLSQGGAMGMDIRARQAEEFETWRNRLMGQMTGPAYSVARWFVQHKQNPYVPSAAEGIERDIGAREAQLPGLQEAAGQGPGGIDAQIGAKAQQLSQEIEGLRSEAEEGEREREEGLALSRRGPETPSWMPEYVPGVGKYLGALPRVPTPSGQQLTKMQPSQAQYLSGAIDWFGGRPWEDILAEAEVMQPRAPRRTATQWRPQTQRRV